MNVPEPKGELSTPTKSLKALPENKETKEEAEAEVRKSIMNVDNIAKKEKAEPSKKAALVQLENENAPIEKIEFVPTKQEVVYEVFGHAHDARKQQVTKSDKPLPTRKEMGFVGEGTESGGPESLTQTHGVNKYGSVEVKNYTLRNILEFPVGKDKDFYNTPVEGQPINLNRSDIAHVLELEAHNANKDGHNITKMWDEHSYQNTPGINMTDRLIDYINGGKQQEIPVDDELMKKYKDGYFN